MKRKRIQIKICGLTDVEQALQCAALGADAIGCVFYPKSPRYVSDEQAKKICDALPQQVKTVGVFVNEDFSHIMQKVRYCNLDIIQLHGLESPEIANRLYKENLIVIKALFIEGSPSIREAENYNVSAYLTEFSKGALPGGNALAWNWKEAKTFGKKYPLILAGGLSPQNVFNAIKMCEPNAVDVSSGVESSPGQKDIDKVKIFIKEALQYELSNSKKVF